MGTLRFGDIREFIQALPGNMWSDSKFLFYYMLGGIYVNDPHPSSVLTELVGGRGPKRLVPLEQFSS